MKTMKVIIVAFLLFIPIFCIGIVYNNFLTVDPSQPLSYTNKLNIQDAISMAHSIPGNTQITVVAGNFGSFAISPRQSGKALRILGTKVSESHITTIVQQGDAPLAQVLHEKCVFSHFGIVTH
ncbi:MAG: hypothetical protein Q8M98_03090 [Candidatus Cloacimonadaceae bacterium]|nr:hypothetical protein [Candidatus Cloacimonadaceae bacterium]MDP3113740.1 hypothetical protein [Candidatus Cloacimonadaceae bacterium]